MKADSYSRHDLTATSVAMLRGKHVDCLFQHETSTKHNKPSENKWEAQSFAIQVQNSMSFHELATVHVIH